VLPKISKSFSAFTMPVFFFFFFFEPPHRPFFVMGFFKIGSCKQFAWTGFQLRFSPISASWVARITEVSHWHLATMPLYLAFRDVWLGLAFGIPGVWALGLKLWFQLQL
jgi:hypothetical protein